MMYLVFSLDNDGCQEVWECFEDRESAERCLADSYCDSWMDYEKNFEERGSEFTYHGPYDDPNYALLSWKDEEDGKKYTIEFFLVEIPESKIMRAFQGKW